MGVNPVIVHRTHNDAEAALIKGLLEEEGIACNIASDIPHGVYPITVDGLGEIRISVAETNAEAAKAIIHAYFE